MNRQDEKDAEEWLEKWEMFHTFKPSTPKERQLAKLGFVEGRRTLEEKQCKAGDLLSDPGSDPEEDIYTESDGVPIVPYQKEKGGTNG